jgi:transglutaminase-like putative cysteine protease
LLPGTGSLSAAPRTKPTPAPVSFAIAPAPAWVKAVEPAPKGNDADPGGISYLLVDRQENVALQSAYYHESRQVISDNGVQNGAAVSVTFDPAYQELIFHSLQVTRRGVRANRLDRSHIKLFQREKDLESFMYDGSYTAQCELEDIRPGDTIEFAYTVKGANPVKGGRYSKVFYTDWNSPAHRVVTRFLYPEQRNLRFAVKNRSLKPTITTSKGTTEWLAEQTDVPARRTDPDVPSDYNPNGWVQVSEFESWQAVVDWGVPLFQPEISLSADLQAEAARLREIPELDKRALSALRLVQEQVRYLGIESGVGSHRPTPPSEVFRRRFGDCKDKTLLLVTLLRQCSIEATPALVSTVYRGTIAERLPAPDDFNHAIVQLKIGNQTHWFDPTRSPQRGPLSEIYVRDLKLALLLQPGTTALTSYSPPAGSLPRRKISENYRVPAPGETGELEVITESYGLSAERTRNAFQESGRDEIQKQYLKYYARLFPRVSVKKPMEFEEITDANACRTREFYSIPDIWTKNEEENRFELSLFPGDIAEAMGSVGSGRRDDPLDLNFPANITQVINAAMFDRWSITSKNLSINNPFFRFTDTAIAEGRRVTMTFSYEAVADRVAPADLPAYNAALTKVRDTLGYTLYYQKPGQAFDFAGLFKHFHWRMALLALGVLTVAVVFSAFFFVWSKRPIPLIPPAGTLPQHRGLGGWLILVGIHQVIRPIFFVVNIVTLAATVFNTEAWKILTDPGGAAFHPSWKPGLLCELIGNLIALVFSALLLLLFFRKRAVWPRAYAAFLISYLAFTIFDFIMVANIPAAAEAQGGTLRDVIHVAAAVIVWVPYCFISKRVKATFTR